MNKLVYIIDDDPVYLKFMQGHFSQMDGFQTKVFNTGDDALTNLSSEKPFLIILDHHLAEPNKSGIYYLKEILKKDSKIPVIYITADRDAALKETVQKMGVKGYLIKDKSFLVYLRTAMDSLAETSQKKGFFKKLFG